MENKFFTFIKPYLSFIDNGHLYRKPVSWLYTLLAVVNLFLPIYGFNQSVDDVDFTSAKSIIVFLLLWLTIAFACWVSFQLWWDRKTKVTTTSVEGDEFVATPVFSHLIQTLGEWFGTWIGIVGFSGALLSTFAGIDVNYLSSQLGIPFLDDGFLYVILMPIYGFLIIVGARFLAELFRALSSIANNTRKN